MFVLFIKDIAEVFSDKVCFHTLRLTLYSIGINMLLSSVGVAVCVCVRVLYGDHAPCCFSLMVTEQDKLTCVYEEYDIG